MKEQELLNGITDILAQYHSGKKSPERVMEVISALLNSVRDAAEVPGNMVRICRVVENWEQGDRPDTDALATIDAVARQLTSLQDGSC